MSLRNSVRVTVIDPKDDHYTREGTVEEVSGSMVTIRLDGDIGNYVYSSNQLEEIDSENAD
ncbi:hypothetical protein [Neobacillus bataviensis]|uniref:hypothetical protein n=1 Tax=Neobacillus bataviensis TaxID=220685 RepID=UPI001CBC3CF7|nr:hypothetical protein [Neobacillus bataviensis]